MQNNVTQDEKRIAGNRVDIEPRRMTRVPEWLSLTLSGVGPTIGRSVAPEGGGARLTDEQIGERCDQRLGDIHTPPAYRSRT